MNKYDKNRFPFIANEIFNCEINSLLDKFFDAPEQKSKDSEHESEEEEEEHKVKLAFSEIITI